MKLYLIWACVAVLVTLVSAKNLNPKPEISQELAEEVGKIEENYAEIEKEQENAVKEVERQFAQQEAEQAEAVENIEDKISQLEADDQDAADEIEEKIAQIEDEEMIDDAAKKVAKDWEAKQKEFEDTRAILNLPNIKQQIIEKNSGYSPATALEIFSVKKNILPDGTLKSLRASYKLKCNAFQCDKCNIKVSFHIPNIFHLRENVDSFNCITYKL